MSRPFTIYISFFRATLDIPSRTERLISNFKLRSTETLQTFVMPFCPSPVSSVCCSDVASYLALKDGLGLPQTSVATWKIKLGDRRIAGTCNVPATISKCRSDEGFPLHDIHESCSSQNVAVCISSTHPRLISAIKIWHPR